MFMDKPVFACETLTACALFAPPVAPAASPAATSKVTPVASSATPSHTFRVITPPLEPRRRCGLRADHYVSSLDKPPESTYCALIGKTLDRRRRVSRRRAG